MKAMIMTGTGGPDIVEAVERSEPVPDLGEALVEIAAADYLVTRLRRTPGDLPEGRITWRGDYDRNDTRNPANRRPWFARLLA